MSVVKNLESPDKPKEEIKISYNPTIRQNHNYYFRIHPHVILLCLWVYFCSVILSPDLIYCKHLSMSFSWDCLGTGNSKS